MPQGLDDIGKLDKRMETVDKEDDWLGDDLSGVLSSRRRLYPAVYLGDYDDGGVANGGEREGDELGVGMRGQPEEEDIRCVRGAQLTT